MNRIYAGLLAVGSLSAVLIAQDKCGFHYDASKRLTAYQLTPEQEALFQTNDGNQLSPFWYVWDEIPTMDKAVLNCIENQSSGNEDCKENVADAQLTLRAAWGDKGVYLYFSVLDDNFLSMPPGRENYGHFYDVCEIFVDRHSAAELYSDLSLFLDPTLSQLSRTTNQFQIPFGAVGENPVAFDFVVPYSPMEDWRTWPGDWMYRFDDLSFVDAATNFCIHSDVINGVAGCRKQEWLIPWRVWGAGYNNGTVEEGYGTKPAEGTALAMTFGYNDLDPTADQSPLPSTLRWRNQRDPWLKRPGECPDETQTVDAWGEIVFGASLASVITAADKAPLDGSAGNTAKYYTSDRVTADEDANQTYDIDATKVPDCSAIRTRFPRRPRGSTGGAFSRAETELYSITGRRLGGSRAVRGNLIVCRGLDASGKIVTRKLIDAR